ncbi:HNH endonuclease [Planctomycetota bacterium]|nr:HNH endonuclease [Planctomycetota bacterium]
MSLLDRLRDFQDKLEGHPRQKEQSQREDAYRQNAKSFVQDGVLTDEELSYLGSLQVQLGVSDTDAEAILQTVITDYFKDCLSSGSYTNPNSAAKLLKEIRRLIKSLRANWKAMKYALKPSILGYLARVLDEMLVDNILDDREISTFQTICGKLGLPFETVCSRFKPSVYDSLEQYIHETVAGDSPIVRIRGYVYRVSRAFQLSERQINNLTELMSYSEKVQAIRLGDFQECVWPKGFPPNMEKCIYVEHHVRFLYHTAKSNLKEVAGILALTDRRIYFFPHGGATRKMLLDKVSDVEVARRGVLVQGNIGNMTGLFELPDADLFAEVLYKSVKIAKRIDEPNSAKRGRHIPQAVKHRVWIRDGGRCVECGINERLELDHIIPFSKGGANTETNIQLLCERCNIRKGAKI